MGPPDGGASFKDTCARCGDGLPNATHACASQPRLCRLCRLHEAVLRYLDTRPLSLLRQGNPSGTLRLPTRRRWTRVEEAGRHVPEGHEAPGAVQRLRTSSSDLFSTRLRLHHASVFLSRFCLTSSTTACTVSTPGTASRQGVPAQCAPGRGLKLSVRRPSARRCASPTTSSFV